MKISTVLLALLNVVAISAWAARPFVTDDARLTTEHSCQLESWTRVYRHSHEVWALPACNPTGNLEFTFGGGAARTDDSSAGWSLDYVFQAKTLFKPLTTNGWGAGAAIGAIRHPEVSPGPNLLGNQYAYVPVSFSFADDLLVVHVNAGWLHDRASRRHQSTWGLGAEVNLDAHWTLIAESFGNSVDTPYWQAGVRYSVIPGLLQLDTTAGRQYNNSPDNQWLSFGVRYTPAKIF